MIKKYSVLICVVISVILIVIATLVYPGGSLLDKNSVGFEWSKNFISNLFESKAINGLENPSRIWAIIGMAFHSVGYGIFFINMAKKISSRHAATILKLVGAFNILFNFLIVTPLHDIMVTISSTLSLLGLFYITVFILMTKRHVFKFSCIICLLTFYYTLFLYGSGNWGLLAIMQKISFICSMLLILGLEYFTTREDFKHIKPDGQKIQATNR
ncbi:hypothetical protein FLJC2902T_22370 [Flavobacterium limnosediminis JC2902]|uniref:Uncharacterized protein n=1 Tax=Flavobacterium limnosediminis JC2902 TaxID=1341181 RepID=V6SK85_9FLAO|nr:hypothetical protein [Flavobacterium limnosediminis]ESU27128.1 hypothetical protein FLJC2902T_22370 [Flavobacterium limnosediminis JC2902]